jgi:methylated-DNA-protein-cysteine methyltransferase related protein
MASSRNRSARARPSPRPSAHRPAPARPSRRPGAAPSPRTVAAAATRARRGAGADDAPAVDDAAHIARLYRHIYTTIRRIPRGRVATYGQIALLSGLPGGHRIVALALRVSTPSMGLPWQRVVGKKSKTQARIAILDPMGAAMQRTILESEGVEVTDDYTIPLTRFGWLPRGTR